MHAVLLWTCCNKEVFKNNFQVCFLNQRYNCDALQALMRSVQKSIKPSITRSHMPVFFWKHLKEDLHALRQFLSINFDDVILLMHLTTKNILVHPEKSTLYGDRDASLLLDRQDRDNWEKLFSETYILPVIRVRMLIEIIMAQFMYVCTCSHIIIHLCNIIHGVHTQTCTQMHRMSQDR